MNLSSPGSRRYWTARLSSSPPPRGVPCRDERSGASCAFLAQRLRHPAGPLAPVAAAQGGEGEGQGEAGGEEGVHLLSPGPVHGWRSCAVWG